MLFNKNKTKENTTVDEENKMVELTDEQLKQVNGGNGPFSPSPALNNLCSLKAYFHNHDCKLTDISDAKCGNCPGRPLT